MANTESNPILTAYQASEELYDSAQDLVHMLQAWSVPGRPRVLSRDAAHYIRNNIHSAQAALAQIQDNLAPWLNRRKNDNENRQ